MYEEEYEDIAEEVERRLKEESKFLSKLVSCEMTLYPNSVLTVSF